MKYRYVFAVLRASVVVARVATTTASHWSDRSGNSIGSKQLRSVAARFSIFSARRNVQVFHERHRIAYLTRVPSPRAKRARLVPGDKILARQLARSVSASKYRSIYDLLIAALFQIYAVERQNNR